MAKVITFGELMLRLAPEGYLRFVQADKLGATFGGGGHYFAAACVIEGTIDEVKEKLLREVEKYI